MDWKDALKAVAPTLATAIGGPLAGGAVKYLSGKLLGDENASEEDLKSAIIGASPDTLALIKQIDSDYKTEMKRLGIELDKLHLQDRANARDLAKSTSIIPQVILSAVFIFGYFGIVFSIIRNVIEIPPEQAQLITVLLGVLTAGVANIMQFWFGSSHGSKSKESQKPPS